MHTTSSYGGIINDIQMGNLLFLFTWKINIKITKDNKDEQLEAKNSQDSCITRNIPPHIVDNQRSNRKMILTFHLVHYINISKMQSIPLPFRAWCEISFDQKGNNFLCAVKVIRIHNQFYWKLAHEYQAQTKRHHKPKGSPWEPLKFYNQKRKGFLYQTCPRCLLWRPKWAK